MYSSTSLRDHFLISMPQVQDDSFAHTITYVCHHSEYGAMGLVINRPIGFDLGALAFQLGIEYHPAARQQDIYDGGPLQRDRGFVLHSGSSADNWLSCHSLNDELCLTTSNDILEAICNGHGPENYLITLGYAGWAPGQLEREMSDNLWLSCPAKLDIMFAVSAQQRMQAAASMMGINLNLLSLHSGTA